MAIVCLMTMVLLTSCGNIEEDGNIAIEKFEKWRGECVKEHAESDVDEIIKAIKESKSNQAAEYIPNFFKSVEDDIKLIISKTFDPLFDKYGEKKVLAWLENKASEETYKEIKLNSKEELYNSLINASISMYSEKYHDKFELEGLKLKTDMIRNKYGW